MQEAKVSPPYPLLWLRYTGFILLYPLGVSSELTMAWLAMPVIKAKHIGSITMPNAANFAFDYHTACWVIVALYLPGAPPTPPIQPSSLLCVSRCDRLLKHYCALKHTTVILGNGLPFVKYVNMCRAANAVQLHVDAKTENIEPVKAQAVIDHETLCHTVTRSWLVAPGSPGINMTSNTSTPKSGRPAEHQGSPEGQQGSSPAYCT